MQLDDEILSVKPGICMIPPGVRHRAIGEIRS
jgi:mannose-6-phosphate isomerase-like protein (cupin superfamily)